MWGVDTNLLAYSLLKHEFPNLFGKLELSTAFLKTYFQLIQIILLFTPQ